MGRRWRRWGLCAALLGSSLSFGQAAPPEPLVRTQPMSLDALTFRFQNPVDNDVRTLLVREDLSFGVGDENRLQSATGVRGSLPFSLGAGWTLVTRLNVPIILAADPVLPNSTYYGIGDSDVAGLVTPLRDGPIWAGAAVRIPTATSDKLGSGKLSVGPSLALVFQPHPWTFGAVAEQVWSIAGNKERTDYSRLRVEPVLSFNLPDSWYLTSTPEVTANWNAAAGQRWLVPIGGGGGKVVRLGDLPFDLQIEGFYNVVHPDLGPTWSLRAQFGLVGGK